MPQQLDFFRGIAAFQLRQFLRFIRGIVMPLLSFIGDGSGPLPEFLFHPLPGSLIILLVAGLLRLHQRRRFLVPILQLL